MKSTKKTSIALLCFLFLSGSLSSAHAQNFSEWFRQKKTQQKYLLSQIAALQVYIGYAKKGYEIAGSGLSAIREITDGEFNLHHVFINGLKKVNPVIRNDVRVAEIIVFQVDIIRSFNALVKSKYPDIPHLPYISLVADGVISDCYNDLEELLMVITSGKLEMEDDERLQRISSIHERMLDRSAFTQRFCNDAALLLRQKQNEQRSIENLRRYYEIN